jgi:GNAT superfamily N-acetyltransferase
MGLLLLEPAPLAQEHQLAEFDSGEQSLDDWLKRRAQSNNLTGASRTFVVANGVGRVYGFYALAAGAIFHAQASSTLKRNMPDPIPVMVLGRLAVDREVQGHRLGGALLQDALRRVITVSESVGVKALLVHALNEKAKLFYEHYGFQATPFDPMTLMLNLTQAESVKKPQ